jgi:hypothetical protein
MASAQINFDAEDSGWYRDDGFHEVDNENYLTGTFDFNNVRTERHSFFVFDLSNIDNVTNAILRLNLPTTGYNSPDDFETFTLFDFGGSVDSLINGTGGIGAFDDLGTGVSFGSVDVSLADENSFIDIQLNTDGIAFLDAAVGGTVAIGGAVTTLESTLGDEWIFGNTGPDPTPTPSLFVAVPEPSSIALIGCAFAFASTRRRRRC